MDTMQTEQILALRKGQVMSEQSGNHWPKDLQEQLRCDYIVYGMGLSELAIKYERTETAIVQQLAKMGLLEQQCSVKRQRSGKICKCLCRKFLNPDCPNRMEAYKYA